MGSQALQPAEAQEITVGGSLGDALIDRQVATAKAYPRDLVAVVNEALTMATLDKRTAETMFYTLERTDKNGNKVFIRGPSIRLAEIFSSAWGNLRVQAAVVREEHKFIVAEATAFDVQKNTAVSLEVQRRITTKYGKRFGDDMVGVTGAAAVSIAFRNALFRVIPRVYVDKAQRAAEDILLDGKMPLSEVIARGVKFFTDQGATEAEVFAVFDVTGVEAMTRQHALDMMGFANRIRDKDLRIEEFIAIGQVSDDEDDGKEVAELNAALGADGDVDGTIREVAKNDGGVEKDGGGDGDGEVASREPEVREPAEDVAEETAAEPVDEGGVEAPGAEAAGDDRPGAPGDDEVVALGLDNLLVAANTATSVEELELLTLHEDAPQEQWAIANAFLRRNVNRLEGRSLYDGFSAEEKNACKQALKRLK